jgi:hypothetical protein
MGIGTDCIVSCKSNYHSIMTAPKLCNTVSIKYTCKEIGKENEMMFVRNKLVHKGH